MKRLLFALLLIASTHAEANDTVSNDSCCPCDSSCQELGFFTHADFLYLKSHQGGLEYQIGTDVFSSEFTTDPSSSVFTSNNKFQELKSDWRGGYRVGLGYRFCCEWTALADWTHYEGHAHGSGKQSGLKSSGHWTVHYDVLDILAQSPTYCACSSMSWNYFGGLKAADIDQKVKAHNQILSTTSTDGQAPTLTTTAYTLSERSDFDGIGPQIGLKGDWDIGCGFSLYGNAAGSLVFGSYDAKLRSSGQNTSVLGLDDVDDNSFTFKSKSRDRLCDPVVDLGLGVSYQKSLCYCGHEASLMLKLGWEHHQWFNHNKMQADGSASFYGQAGSNYGDLCLDGATLSAALFF